MGTMSGSVVVGVDGSASSLDAVAYAAREAACRKATLRVVHALARSSAHLPLGATLPESTRMRLRTVAGRLVEDAVHEARALAPDVDVFGTVLPGGPLSVLDAESRTAALVVVGSRGLGGFGAPLLGSTATGLAAHGRCPVLVVRERTTPAGPIVLGVDGSPAGAAAVRFALDEAALHGADVVAVHAWTTWNAPMPPPQDPALPYANRPGALATAEERLLAEALAGTCERYPDVKVEHKVVHGPTRQALIEASRSARLTVVGSRGHGGFTGLRLGSVGHAVLHHAHSPVAVVRG
ncbi:universal stress protein [Streptomyces poonensis]|uniref:Universal stress protein n=2 Tax=Streptomyces poonensis TaxID=68255 RepID=A0A918UL58_9ACTN|nr:universal stress protein [Streptomyces poonensis]